MTFTFTIWELVFLMTFVGMLNLFAAHYWEMISRYNWCKRRADQLRRAQRI